MPTPLVTYSLDWVVLNEHDGEECLDFAVEADSDLLAWRLREAIAAGASEWLFTTRSRQWGRIWARTGCSKTTKAAWTRLC
ncbi:hypothetical protein [Aquabacterium sp.]|uniref:hypothetical protein n=1 Tax=Aquabacterium sp. TaxID=1872578 RepID=UPI002489D21D|nr:hypothetical protein [Aquabacterium sp.]MDI1349849.1 hypothetical protein [Aquabacterium sp.]